jgi:hypothetical protein
MSVVVSTGICLEITTRAQQASSAGDMGTSLLGMWKQFTMPRYGRVTGIWHRKDNQTLSLTASGPRLTLTDGSYCKTSSDETIQKMRASTVIDFICDMSIFGTGTPHLIAQLPPNDENAACGFYFEWKTHVRF